MQRVRLGSFVVVALLVVAAMPAEAAPSPFLGTIAFESERLGRTDLFIMRPDGTGQTRLNTPGGGADASWSPDGRRIAFGADPEGDGNVDVYVMDVPGGALRQLTTSPGLDIWPDWLRGGNQIVFSSTRAGPPNIFIMNADGTGQRQLTHGTNAASLTPVGSPTGRQVLFARATPTEPPKLWLMNVDGTGQRQLTPAGPWEDIDPAWSVDERQIAFSSNRLGSYEIFLMGADGSNPTALTNQAGFDWTPTFSPDNRYIAWTASRAGNPDVWVMNKDGSGKTRLTTDPAFDGFPDWHQTRVLQ
jgi:Tol biopolymer transport system component